MLILIQLLHSNCVDPSTQVSSTKAKCVVYKTVFMKPDKTVPCIGSLGQESNGNKIRIDGKMSIWVPDIGISSPKKSLFYQSLP
ncbi:hypothetical protein GDO86_014934 [Hymenochirus boettgeri]|uniref:Uncharacterized protein n=1 Tax=Hymenochirus boettgeri TaxID=247094 RepID=A0A8T2JTF8_9PIPI|nr:hypothetical protein GDO86_014934 [Hymenochirus boettgeri]